MQATNDAAIWSGNGGDSFWNNADNWEEGVLPSPDRAVVIQGNAFPQPMVNGAVEVNALIVEEGAHLFVHGQLDVAADATLLGEVSGMGTMTVAGQSVGLSSMQESGWTIFPNPANEFVQLTPQGHSSVDGAVTIQLLTSDGRLIETYQGNLAQVNEALNENFAQLASGMYCIRIIANDAQMLRVVKE
jgi:hypothetical protein